MTSLVFREVSLSDLDRCYQIESEAYEGDEAATREKLPPAFSNIRKDFCVQSGKVKSPGLLTPAVPGRL